MATDITMERDSGFDRTSDYCWINIAVDGKRVGKARVHASLTRITVYSIGIFPEFQRKGYARSVMRRLKRDYNEIIADRVRGTAKGFWSRMGFQADANGNYLWKSSHELETARSAA